MLEVKNLYKEYSTFGKRFPVLDNINFKLEKGEVLGIIGPSGCGKSTLLKIIGNLLQKDKGDILFDKSHEKISTPIVWQDHRLFSWRKVAKNISFPLELSGKHSQKEIKKRVSYLINLIGLEEFEEYYPSQISGGMKQRVALARALAIEPDILLLDEPFASVDFQKRIILQEELNKIKKITHLSMIYVTHDIRDIVNISDKILVLSKRPARILKNIKINKRDNLDKIELEIQNLLSKEMELQEKFPEEKK